MKILSISSIEEGSLTQSVLPQTGDQEVALFGLEVTTASFAVLLLSKSRKKDRRLLIEPWDKVFYFQLKSLTTEIKFCAYNQDLAVTPSEDLADRCDSNWWLWLYGLSALPSVQKTAYESQDTGNETYVKERSKQVQVFHKWKHKRVWRQSLSSSWKTKPGSLYWACAIWNRQQADPTLAKEANQGADCWPKWERTILTEVRCSRRTEVRRVVQQGHQEPVSQILAVRTKEDAQPARSPALLPATAKGTQEEGHVGSSCSTRESSLYRCGGSQGTQKEGHVGETSSTEGDSLYRRGRSQETQEEGHVGGSWLQQRLSYTGVVEAKGTQEEAQSVGAPIDRRLQPMGVW